MPRLIFLLNNFITNGDEIIASQHKDGDAEPSGGIQQDWSPEAGEYQIGGGFEAGAEHM